MATVKKPHRRNLNSAIGSEVSRRMPLSPREAEDLSRLESVVESGRDAFVAVGDALAEIAKRRLYRDTHGSFKRYLSERWSISPQHARRMIFASKANAAFREYDGPKPDGEFQMRVLKALKSDVDRIEAWDKAVKSAGGLCPSGRTLQRVVNAMIAKDPECAANPPKPPGPPPAPEAVDAALSDGGQLAEDLLPIAPSLVVQAPPEERPRMVMCPPGRTPVSADEAADPSGQSHTEVVDVLGAELTGRLMPDDDDERAAIQSVESEDRWAPVVTEVVAKEESTKQRRRRDFLALLKAIPVREKLAGPARRRLTLDAWLYFRARKQMKRLESLIQKYQRHLGDSVKIGPYARRVHQVTRLHDPRGIDAHLSGGFPPWSACLSCFDPYEQGSTGIDPKTGKECGLCKGDGYYVS